MPRITQSAPFRLIPHEDPVTKALRVTDQQHAEVIFWLKRIELHLGLGSDELDEESERV